MNSNKNALKSIIHARTYVRKTKEYNNITTIVRTYVRNKKNKLTAPCQAAKSVNQAPPQDLDRPCSLGRSDAASAVVRERVRRSALQTRCLGRAGVEDALVTTGNLAATLAQLRELGCLPVLAHQRSFVS